MTIINPNSISGISSITALNSTDAINLFKADGTSANVIAGVTTITGSGNALEIVGGVVRNRGTTSARFVANNGSAEGYFGWSSGVLTVGQADATLSLEASGSNYIQFKTNGTERLRIGSTGISTFTEDVRIVKTSGPLLELTTNTGAADATLRLSEGAAGSTTNGGGMFYSGADNKLYITCGTNSTTKRITINRDDGKVGINTNNPLSGTHISDGTAYGSPQNPSRKATLTISAGSEASADIQLLSANYNHIFFGDSADPNTGMIHYEHTGSNVDSLVFSTAGSEKLRIKSDGKVGIGTIPTKDLHVDGTIFASGATPSLDGGIRLQPNNSGTSNGGVIYGGAHNDNNHAIFMRRGQDGLGSTVDINSYATFRIFTGGGLASQDERLRITSDGKVGINAANPNSLLEVRGTAGTYTNGITVFTGNTTHSGSNAKNGVGLYSFGDALKGGLSSNLLYSNSSTPSQSYTTRSSGQIEISNTTASNQTSLMTFGGYYKGTTTFVERLRIDSHGRVMVGTTTEGFATYGDNFTIADGNHCGMTIRSGTSGYGTIYFSDADDGSADEVRGFLEYFHNTNALSLGSNGTPRLRLNADGLVRIGGSLGNSFQCDLDVVRNNSTLTDVMLVKGNSSNGFIRFQDNDNSCNFTLGADDGAGLGGGSFILYDRVNSAYRWSVDSSGNMKVWDGDVTLASGHGIDFSATSDASGMNNELLDDYEEGIATFALHIGGSEASGVSYTYNTAPYIKVGRMVWCAISMFATNLPTDTGVIDIVGLPFTDGGGGGYREPAFLAANHGGVGSSLVITGALHGNNTKIRIRKNGNQDLNGSDIGSTFWMHGHITYKANV